MKNRFKILMFGLLAFFISSCASKTNIPSAQITNLLKFNEFTFMAERANPMNSDVMNVMNSFPNSSALQMLNLDYGYTLEIKKEEIKAELPYFGRMFNPSMDQSKNSYRFSSKDFTLNQKAGKKGSVIYTIQVKDQQNLRRMILEVFPNGKAYLSIDSNDRQPISYHGYILENAAKNK